MNDIERAAQVVAELGSRWFEDWVYEDGWRDGIDAALAAILALPPTAHPPADEGRVARMQARLDAAESLINAAVDLMADEQVGQWTGVRAWLEQDESDYEPADEGSAKNLTNFAIELLDDWPNSFALDGFDLQDLCITHGLLVAKNPQPTEPCSEHCDCAEFHGINENGKFDGPVDCYVRADFLKAAIAAAGKENGNG